MRDLIPKFADKRNFNDIPMIEVKDAAACPVAGLTVICHGGASRLSPQLRMRIVVRIPAVSGTFRSDLSLLAWRGTNDIHS